VRSLLLLMSDDSVRDSVAVGAEGSLRVG